MGGLVGWCALYSMAYGRQGMDLMMMGTLMDDGPLVTADYYEGGY